METFIDSFKNNLEAVLLHNSNTNVSNFHVSYGSIRGRVQYESRKKSFVSFRAGEKSILRKKFVDSKTFCCHI